MNAPVAHVTMVEPVTTQLDRTPAFGSRCEEVNIYLPFHVSNDTHTQIYLYILIFSPIKLSIYSSTWSVYQIFQMLHVSNILLVTN